MTEWRLEWKEVIFSTSTFAHCLDVTGQLFSPNILKLSYLIAPPFCLANHVLLLDYFFFFTHTLFGSIVPLMFLKKTLFLWLLEYQPILILPTGFWQFSLPPFLDLLSSPVLSVLVIPFSLHLFLRLLIFLSHKYTTAAFLWNDRLMLPGTAKPFIAWIFHSDFNISI